MARKISATTGERIYTSVDRALVPTRRGVYGASSRRSTGCESVWGEGLYKIVKIGTGCPHRNDRAAAAAFTCKFISTSRYIRRPKHSAFSTLYALIPRFVLSLFLCTFLCLPVYIRCFRMEISGAECIYTAFSRRARKLVYLIDGSPKENAITIHSCFSMA